MTIALKERSNNVPAVAAVGALSLGLAWAGSGSNVIVDRPRAYFSFVPTSPAVASNTSFQADRTASWAKARGVILRWAALEEGWDGDEGVPPTGAQLSAVRAFVRAAERRGISEPRPFIASDGEIGFHWDSPVGKASVAFLSDGQFLAFCPRAGANPVQVTGPLDLANASAELLAALYNLR